MPEVKPVLRERWIDAMVSVVSAVEATFELKGVSKKVKMKVLKQAFDRYKLIEIAYFAKP